jgi:hypothetical protein
MLVSEEAGIALAHRLQIFDGKGRPSNLDTAAGHSNRGDTNLLQGLQ